MKKQHQPEDCAYLTQHGETLTVDRALALKLLPEAPPKIPPSCTVAVTVVDPPELNAPWAPGLGVPLLPWHREYRYHVGDQLIVLSVRLRLVGVRRLRYLDPEKFLNQCQKARQSVQKLHPHVRWNKKEQKMAARLGGLARWNKLPAKPA